MPDVVLRFVAYLAESGLAHVSIPVYLSGLWFTQIAVGLPDPQLGSIPQLHYVLRDIHRSGRLPSGPCHLPITPELMRVLYHCSSQPDLYGPHDCIMLWPACCLGFFGFLRSEEFTCPSLEAFHNDMLCSCDVTVDSHQSPSRLSVHLHRSKADSFGLGVTIFLGWTGYVICHLGIYGQEGVGHWCFRTALP